MIMNWTEETMRAENEYRRQQLHRLAGHRRTREQPNRSSRFWGWLRKGGHRSG
jgi:hypothetical protein